MIKYDHRDFGYSSKIDFDKNPYDVIQLAKDALTILDTLNIKKVHIIVHSMGGFIVQILGIYYPDRVLSMVTASASTNSPKVPMPLEKTWQIFMQIALRATRMRFNLILKRIVGQMRQIRLLIL